MAGAKFDDAVDLIDPDTRSDVRDLLVALAAWTRRMRVADDAAVAS